MSKNNLRGITLVRGPIWGIPSLTLIISWTQPNRPRICITCLFVGLLWLASEKNLRRHWLLVWDRNRLILRARDYHLLPARSVEKWPFIGNNALSIDLNKLFALKFVSQGKENTKRTLQLVRTVGEFLSSTSHSSQRQTVVKSNFVDIAIYKEKSEDLSGRNISEGGADIVIPDSKNIFPKINDSVTLQVNPLFDWTVALLLVVLFLLFFVPKRQLRYTLSTI